MSNKTHNLILLHHPDGQGRQDFEEITAKIKALAPEIDTHIVLHTARLEQSGLPEEIWTRPTLTVAFRLSEGFRPKRGTMLSGRPINKFEQVKRFHEMGIPVPPTLAYPFGRQLRTDVWGSHVILKPSRMGMPSGARHTYLMRTERVADLAERLFPPQHPARAAPLLVQRFIDTGEHPANYRVLCLLGEPILCMEYKLKEPRPPLDAPDDVLLNAPIASNTDGLYSHELVAPPDVLAFARQVATSMPLIPLQGMDIIREVGTGKFYVLENNPGGNTWHFSSKMSVEGRKEITREQRIAQFGAWDIAARVLAERTLKDAK